MKIIVIGAGLGGLAAALRLAHEGHDVTVLEKTDQVGGRNRRVKVGGCDFDGGPTLVMMLDPFRKLFRDVGEQLEDHLQLTLCDPGYRVFYADGTRLDATTYVPRMVEQLKAISPRDAEVYPKLLQDLKALYQDSIPHFVEKNFYGPLDFFGPANLGRVAKHRMLANWSKRIGKYLEHPKLQMLLSFQSMYLGLSPFEAPWVYATLAYMELGEGIWYPKGGVPAISEVIADLAKQKGANIHLNTHVAQIQDNKVWEESGKCWEADAIICNADLPYAERELLHIPEKERKHSCSAFMIYADYEGGLPDLLHHNVFFGSDFYKNLDQIFNKKEVPEEPAFYACISKRSEPSRAPEGHENLFVLVPCPNLDRPWREEDALTLEKAVVERLSLRSEKIRAKRTFTPENWANDLNLNKGAAFGLSHHFNQSAYFRPSNRSKQNPHVYFVGASTIPGNGMPMVLISADLAVQRMKHDGMI